MAVSGHRLGSGHRLRTVRDHPYIPYAMRRYLIWAILRTGSNGKSRKF